MNNANDDRNAEDNISYDFNNFLDIVLAIAYDVTTNIELRVFMIKVVAVGKIKEKAMRSLIDEYVKRLKPFTKLEIIEVADEIAPQNNSEAQNQLVKEKEGERILSKIKEQEYVILLDLWGDMLDSEQFSKKLEHLQTYQTSNITFVIAGSLGPGKNVYERCNYRWKLSDLTFTHQMTRILVLEQIYRAYMIQNNNPYHK